MLAGKTLTDYTILFSLYDFNKNDSIILSYLKDAWNRSNKTNRSNKVYVVWNNKRSIKYCNIDFTLIKKINKVL